MSSAAVPFFGGISLFRLPGQIQPVKKLETEPALNVLSRPIKFSN
jgi:hypothetical protein